MAKHMSTIYLVELVERLDVIIISVLYSLKWKG